MKNKREQARGLEQLSLVVDSSNPKHSLSQRVSMKIHLAELGVQCGV